MAKKKQVEPVPRYQLLCAIQNTPEDARFLVGIAVNEHEDFLNGLCLNKSRHFTRSQLLDQVERSDFQMFPSILERDDHLLITPRLYAWKNSINHSQCFPATPEADTYTHVVDKCNPYYDIFFHRDRERKIITFARGDQKKSQPVVEHTDWCWKPTRKGLLCQDIDCLERNFLDPFWNPIAVTIGRKVLNIKPAV